MRRMKSTRGLGVAWNAFQRAGFAAWAPPWLNLWRTCRDKLRPLIGANMAHHPANAWMQAAA
jgi:hypothetical protein